MLKGYGIFSQERVLALGRIPYNQHPFGTQPYAAAGFCGKIISPFRTEQKEEIKT